MKLTFVRPATLLALALGLSACGGKAMFDVGGNIGGLVYSGLVLTNSGSDLAVAAGATSYKFPNQIAYGDSFNISVKTNPLHQSCAPLGADTTGHTIDTAGRMAVISVGVACSLDQHKIGGTIVGMSAAGLVLTNGTAGGIYTAVAPTGADIVYEFGSLVTYGVSYGVSVLTNPAGQKCTVANSTAVMGDTDVTNIIVTCVPEGLGG
ncbi:MAG: hypothetical protein V4508_17290 [Pseudomonadota bacterium]